MGARRIGVALAVVTFIALDLACRAAEPWLMWVASHDRQATVAHLADYLRTPRPHVVFMGSSPALGGFDPAVAAARIRSATGKRVRALNLGITGSDIAAGFLVLKNVIAPRKVPDVIVYGLSEFELKPTGVSPAPETLPYAELLFRVDDFPRYAGSGLGPAAWFLLQRWCVLCRDRRLIQQAAGIALNPFHPWHASYVAGDAARRDGFVAFPEVAPDPAHLERHLAWARAMFTSYRDFAGFNADRLEDFLALARRRGITVVLVTLPTQAVQRDLWGRELVEAYRRFVGSVAARHGATLLDLYADHDPLITDSDFYDPNHLNRRGAAVLTRFVARQALVPLFSPRAGTDDRPLRGPAP